MSVLAPLIGGLLIGLAAAIAFAFDGRIAGISGIAGRLAFGAAGRDDGGRGFRLAFLAGLLGAGLLGVLIAPQAFGASIVPLPAVAVAGVLVGWGTRVANGCTSGHGVCGVARLSPRSLVAVATFMATGVLTVTIVRIFGFGGAS